MDKQRKKFLNYYGDPETTDIAEMHHKFWNNVTLNPRPGSRDDILARVDFIQEELDELREATMRGDFLEVIDALVDIVVVAKGTAVMIGIPWRTHWNEVHRANMSKEVGQNKKRPDMPFDLIKPPGWMGPDHLSILKGQ